MTAIVTAVSAIVNGGEVNNAEDVLICPNSIYDQDQDKVIEFCFSKNILPAN
jgi:hypothetical protein